MISVAIQKVAMGISKIMFIIESIVNSWYYGRALIEYGWLCNDILVLVVAI